LGRQMSTCFTALTIWYTAKVKVRMTFQCHLMKLSGVAFSAWNKKVWIKSIGSKTDARAILDNIRDGTLKNNIVALDADYSFYCGNAPDHPQIFFTHGYSWGSDAVQNIDFDRALALFRNFRDLAAARAQFLEFIRKNQRVFWRASLIDMRYLECPKQLFNRKKPGSIIKSKPDGLPKLGYAELLSGARSLRNTGKTPLSFPYDGPCPVCVTSLGRLLPNLCITGLLRFLLELRESAVCRIIPF